MDLPPGVVEEGGELYRYVTHTSGDGNEWQSRRPVSLDFREARIKRHDYWHSGLQTWILQGVKQEKDRAPGDVMADVSRSVVAPEGQDVLAPVAEPSESELPESEPVVKYE